eukprot:TRINITY_DN48811_c0_g1_i5.p1 TRINITY_DN48811_c0_g1~~TRINITY_DN48811_c0_g1_i5.p1  ORF type:complete len:107 (-),score=23.49 TRINITY_DN48811_c0_g1_i5:56-376(-)
MSNLTIREEDSVSAYMGVPECMSNLTIREEDSVSAYMGAPECMSNLTIREEDSVSAYMGAPECMREEDISGCSPGGHTHVHHLLTHPATFHLSTSADLARSQTLLS